MKIRLRSACSVTFAIETLKGVLSRATNYNPHIVGPIHQYSMFCNESSMLLKNALTDECTRELVVTARHLAIGTVSPPAAAVQMIEADLDDFKRALESAIAELSRIELRWKDGGVFVVPDTNVFVEHPNSFDHIDWHAELSAWLLYDPGDEVRIVVPMIVVDELDRLKRDPKRASRARTSLRDLERLLPGSPSLRAVVQKHVQGKTSDVTIEVLVDDLDHVRLTDADSEVVARALMVQHFAARHVVTMTNDTGMAFRARAVELPVVLLDFTNV